jgi:hypothetical protein
LASGTIDGQIKNVSWGVYGESVPITVKPLITIENTGDEVTRCHVAVAVDKDGKRYAGACWVTDEISVGKTGMTWPYALWLPNRSDLAYLQVEPYSDS